MQPTGREMHGGGQDDFFDQMLSALPTAWAELGSGKSPWELPAAGGGGEDDPAFDESALLASRLRHHQISGGAAAGGFLPLPLFTDRSREDLQGASQALYDGFGAAGMHGAAAAAQQPFGQAGSMPAPPPPAAQGGAAAPPRQRQRARRGQATDPHSIAERLRRERIAERMKALQELVPNANKTDKASMLDEIIDYVKFLQLQVKVLSMSRLGGAAAVAPLVATMSSESNRNGNGANNGGDGNNADDDNGGSTMHATEQQVARLMEEDMGIAMQYLQGKGLCLMPISLASVISSATSSSLLSTVRPVGTGGAPPEGGSPTSQQLVNGTSADDSLAIKNGGRQ
ncbi:unnamed protein product [Alopecurus aequalis]